MPSYTTVYNALSSAGIVSPRARIPVREKKKHLPRDERPNEGDLVQVDGSRHDWFLNGHRLTLHGAIDDATHETVGLYFCENECLLGYNEIMKQIAARKGVFLELSTTIGPLSFLPQIDGFNARFSIPAQYAALHWKAPPPSLDFLFSVKADKKTKAGGSFIYYGYKFRLAASRSACVYFTLCLSESYGLRGFMNGRYYDVELYEPLCDVVGDSMPLVEKNLIYRYLLADTHSGGILLSG